MEVSFNHDDQLLVVGGTGFIGQHVVKKALAQGLSVTVLSKKQLHFHRQVRRHLLSFC